MLIYIPDAPDAAQSIIVISWGDDAALDACWVPVPDVAPAPREQLARTLRSLADAILATAPDSITP